MYKVNKEADRAKERLLYNKWMTVVVTSGSIWHCFSFSRLLVQTGMGEKGRWLEFMRSIVLYGCREDIPGSRQPVLLTISVVVMEMWP